MDSVELLRLLDEIKKLNEQLEAIKAAQIIPQQRRQSDQINEIASALAKAQAEMKVAGKDKENPYFKSRYADLADIVTVSRPALTKNGLSVTQQILTDDDGKTTLDTYLLHSSGQWISSNVRILPTKSDIQSIASYITYMRRYSYAALIGVVVADEDDDAEKAVYEDRQLVAKGTAVNMKYNPKEESYEPITKEQLDELEYELQEYPDIAEQVLDGLKIQSLADMPKSKYGISIRRVREIKNARNNVK